MGGGGGCGRRREWVKEEGVCGRRGWEEGVGGSRDGSRGGRRRLWEEEAVGGGSG